MRDLMHPEIDFRGLTPRRSWEASDRDQVLECCFAVGCEDSDEIEGLENVETDSFADRHRVGYRFSVNNPDGRFLVEQQAYLSARDGQIDWMRVVGARASARSRRSNSRLAAAAMRGSACLRPCLPSALALAVGPFLQPLPGGGGCVTRDGAGGCGVGRALRERLGPGDQP